jgi:hypothetical protein
MNCRATRPWLIPSLHTHLRLDREAGPEFVMGVFAGQVGEVDADRGALDYLDVIGRVALVSDVVLSS